MKNEKRPWYCADCATEIPFSNLRDKIFKGFLYLKTTPQPFQILQKSSKEIKNMMPRFKRVNQLFDQWENSISCDYYDVDDQKKILINQSDLTVMYLNISSLARNIDKLKLVNSLIKSKFDIICMSESRITKNKTLTTSNNIPGYNFEHTSTESEAGGLLM